MDMQQGGGEQAQSGGNNQVAQLFQNVGQGLTIIADYVGKVAPDAAEMAAGLLQGYEQLVQAVAQARQGGGEQPQQRQAAPEQGAYEAGGRNVQQAM